MVRTAELERLAGTGDGGTARLLEDADGRQTVEVQRARARLGRRPLRGLADPPGQHRRWCPSACSARGDTGEFVVPQAALADGYTLVDVSDEPDDGEPAHSGDSVLRGDLAGWVRSRPTPTRWCPAACS